MKSLLLYLDGKKTIIQGIITTVSAYLVFRGVFVAETAAFINALSLLIFGSASVATTSIKNNAQISSTMASTQPVNMFGENSGTTV